MALLQRSADVFTLLMLHSTSKAVIEYSLNQHTVWQLHLFFIQFDVGKLEQGSSSNDD